MRLNCLETLIKLAKSSLTFNRVIAQTCVFGNANAALFGITYDLNAQDAIQFVVNRKVIVLEKELPVTVLLTTSLSC